MRKLIVVRGHEWLHEATSVRNFDAAAGPLASLSLTRSQFVPNAPTLLPFDVDEIDAPHNLSGESEGFILDVELDDNDVEAAEAELTDRFGDELGGIFANPTLQPFPVAPTGPIGTEVDVRTALNLGSLAASQHDGSGVRVAVVDTGINKQQVPVAGGWTPQPGNGPGMGQAGSHGTKCALDVRIAAPGALIYDYPLLTQGGNLVAFMSDAIGAFSELLRFILNNPGALVVSNSWGLYNRGTDAPVGNPQNYSANPKHPFNQITSALVGSGADVLFAAGNCGSVDPHADCGQSDIGPGNSIHGANSHASVLSIGAVSINGDVLGYSSQGPGDLTHEKPDVLGYSHFSYGGTDGDLHSGTSAACPVVAGVVAALRSKPSSAGLDPTQLQTVVRSSATGGNGAWDPDRGYGTVDAGAIDALV